MDLRKVTIVGGGVLGSQIGLMCAYVGKEVTFWLRSEGSVERTKPKLQRYSELMINDLLRQSSGRQSDGQIFLSAGPDPRLGFRHS